MRRDLCVEYLDEIIEAATSLRASASAGGDRENAFDLVVDLDELAQAWVFITGLQDRVEHELAGDREEVTA